MMSFNDQVVIVTGAGRGIGKAVAMRFASEGATVALVSRTRADLDAVAGEIGDAGGRALPVVADVSDRSQVEAMVATVVEAHGRIDVLVNNAGLSGARANLVDLDLDDWDTVMNTNVRGTMLCSKHVLPHMIARRSGSIINVSSLMGRTAEWGRTHYCAAKWGIIGFTQALATETGRHGVRVNCVVPGLVHTEVVEGYMKGLAKEKKVPYEEMYRRFASSHPTNKIVQMSEVAELMLFLASDRAASIHGQSINISAGYWMT